MERQVGSRGRELDVRDQKSSQWPLDRHFGIGRRVEGAVVGASVSNLKERNTSHVATMRRDEIASSDAHENRGDGEIAFTGSISSIANPPA